MVNYQGRVVEVLQHKVNTSFQVVLEEVKRILEKRSLRVVGKPVLPAGKALVQTVVCQE